MMAFLYNLHVNVLTAIFGFVGESVSIGTMGDGMMENGMGGMMLLCILGIIIGALLIILLILLIIYMIKKIRQ